MSKRILAVEELMVSFDGFKALDIAYFELEEKELRVVIGPNGAGKTTFMDVLCGKTKPQTGTAMMDGKDLVKLNEQQIVELGVGRKFQTPSVFGSLSVFDNLLLAFKTDRKVWRSLFYTLSPQARARIEEVAETVGLEDALPMQAAYLSHGQKQWLEIGMLILQDPKLLLIDEPAAGMTDEETAKTGRLLLELANKHSIIVIEHDMEFVKQLARKVTVLCEGKVLTEGPIEKVQEDPQVIERYLGRSHGTRAEKAVAVGAPAAGRGNHG
ncbi:MAG TPA: urea ABC transporter ATP-binding protein UrtD [Fibrobacteria bacterium]|nr:urea ABC transporter ATP-binding protein UrtD [Fibrobacteria bacterium]